MCDPERQQGPSAATHQPPLPVIDRLVKSLRSHVPAVAAVTVVVLFVALRVAYQRFYGPLGVSPEDAGIAYTTSLAEVAATAVALVIGLLMLAVAVLLALAVLLGSCPFRG
jgi:hypothetical protein